MLGKTLKFVLPGRKFKLLGAGRTDAKVSALDAAFELFLEGEPLPDPEEFLNLFNENLPPDIGAMSICLVPDDFNIIHSCREKEYHYYFSFGKKIHAFAAPFMTAVPTQLDLDKMKEAALVFEGTHDFRAYTAKSGREKKFIRTITSCRIKSNTLLTANFFPESSYILQLRGQGFIRYQVRMIMGALFSLGQGKLSLADIKESLKPENKVKLTTVAPGSGLQLHKLTFE